MYYFLHNGSIFVRRVDAPAIKKYGDYVGEFVGESLYVHPRTARSCFSHVTIDGKPTMLEPSVCEGCEHQIDCCLVEDGEERQYKEDLGSPLVPHQDAFDQTAFMMNNFLLILPAGVDPKDFVWP